MEENNNTSRFRNQESPNDTKPSGMIMTVFDGQEKPRSIKLDSFHKNVITFGRNPGNDIVLKSMLVSGDHGRFRLVDGTWMIEDKGNYMPSGSTNGPIYNNASIRHRRLAEGDFIRIDNGIETISTGVLFVFSTGESDNRWKTYEIGARSEISIGRDPHCDIVLPHVSVSKLHAKIVR